MEITLESNKQIKKDISFFIISNLPEWFTPIEDIKEKSMEHMEMPMFIANFNGEDIGFLSLKMHNTNNLEIYNLGVLKEYQNKSVGTQLLKAAEKFAYENKFKYMTVKTLDKSVTYKPYELTRRFYHKNEFIDLEVFQAYWNIENPCLYLIKQIF